jgi:hypothetical protein
MSGATDSNVNLVSAVNDNSTRIKKQALLEVNIGSAMLFVVVVVVVVVVSTTSH